MRFRLRVRLGWLPSAKLRLRSGRGKMVFQARRGKVSVAVEFARCHEEQVRRTASFLASIRVRSPSSKDQLATVVGLRRLHLIEVGGKVGGKVRKLKRRGEDRGMGVGAKSQHAPGRNRESHTRCPSISTTRIRTIQIHKDKNGTKFGTRLEEKSDRKIHFPRKSPVPPEPWYTTRTDCPRSRHVDQLEQQKQHRYRTTGTYLHRCPS